MKENTVKDKSFAFALRVVNLAKYLQSEKREFVLSKQVLRSGTAIGALVREAEHAESKADFIHKMSIAPTSMPYHLLPSTLSQWTDPKSQNAPSNFPFSIFNYPL
jgi:hypothetical protein